MNGNRLAIRLMLIMLTVSPNRLYCKIPWWHPGCRGQRKAACKWTVAKQLHHSARKATLLLGVALCLLPRASYAAKQQPAWNYAKVISFDAQQGSDAYTYQSQVYSNTNNTAPPTTVTNVGSTSYVDYQLILDDGKMLYYGAWRRVSRWQHTPHFTENGTVPYALDKDTLTVVDDSAHTITMKLIKRRIKEVDLPQSATAVTDQRQGSLQSTTPVPGPVTNGGATLQSRAEAGDASAEYALGWKYEFGDGAPQDYSQAAVWLRKAAEQGLANAQFSLGTLYDNGKGVPQDYAQAAVWFRKAAEQGDAAAQYLLGLLYLNGHGLPQDNAQAIVWFRKAAEQGLAEAQYFLGYVLLGGTGVPKDYAESYFWLDLACAGTLKAVKLEDVAKERDLAASHLSPEELSQAQARASKWFAEHTVSK